MATAWQRVYVFVSSTFNDMHAERDYLVKRVFPQLRDWCERRKLRLVDIDLRWGVTEELDVPILVCRQPNMTLQAFWKTQRPRWG